ncbi:hypothetical protein GCM10020358_46690 [Amorphoplanes nipponensis]|uniref:Peptidase MA superfamily protein n=1 Tax=Actinoplanes nipponensis TaxID=135950 RepID=A0A919JSE9_9ACTN|nr:hypothetical protein [Actinoplanes nipponensis]GIE52119.1 hypothetical protein Ani05nite_56530 [Actinoplanes nipponensis]
MIDPAGTTAAPPRRTDRWLALFGVLALLCGGVFAVSMARNRALAGREQHALRIIRTALDRQGAALLHGDRGGWLRDVDPALSADLLRLYANLRGLQVSGWLPRARQVRTGPRWSADVQIRVCFSTPACPRTPETYVPAGDVISARTEWLISGDRAVLTAFDQTGADGSVPWKRAALTFATGRRVVVAAVEELKETQPQAWLPAAERAAQVADRYAVTRPRPGRYVVFLAGEQHWREAVGEDRDAAAFVDRTSKETAFAIIDATALGADPDDERLLRHEFGHIATLLGTLGNRDEWAVEGLAEYIAYAGTPVRSYELVDDARWHVEHRNWTGRLDLEWSAEPAERFGYYAMAFLAMRCLGETYGEPRMLGFFTRVVREGAAPAEAAEAALGVGWEQVESTCRPKILAWLKP